MKIKYGAVIITLLSGVIFTGCGTNFWEKHASPQYGRDRAELMCHPYSDCTQGKWVANEHVLGDPNEAYRQCTEEKLRHENGWSKNTVSMGLEINRCMDAMGYRLVRRYSESK